MRGLSVDWRRRLSVSSVWPNNSYHINLGKSGSTPARSDKKCAQKVRMALSAIFIWYALGSTSWYVAPQSIDYTFLKFSTDFVIQDMHINLMSAISQALHNRAIGLYPVFVFTVSEWCSENGIKVIMIRYKNVLVATPGSNWKAATIIHIQLAYWFIPNMQLFCCDGIWNIFHLFFFWYNLEDSPFYAYSWRSLLLDWLHTLIGLYHVAFHHLNCSWERFRRVWVCKAWPCFKPPSLYCPAPHWLDW